MSNLETVREEMIKMVKDSYKRGGVDVCDALIRALEVMSPKEKTFEFTLPEFVELVKTLKKRVEE